MIEDYGSILGDIRHNFWILLKSWIGTVAWTWTSNFSWKPRVDHEGQRPNFLQLGLGFHQSGMQHLTIIDWWLQLKRQRNGRHGGHGHRTQGFQHVTFRPFCWLNILHVFSIFVGHIPMIELLMWFVWHPRSVPVCLTWRSTSTPTTLARRNQWGWLQVAQSWKNPQGNHFFPWKCDDVLLGFLHQSHPDCVSWWVRRGLKGGLPVTCWTFPLFKMVNRIWQIASDLCLKCHLTVGASLYESHSFQACVATWCRLADSTLGPLVCGGQWRSLGRFQEMVDTVKKNSRL